MAPSPSSPARFSPWLGRLVARATWQVSQVDSHAGGGFRRHRAVAGHGADPRLPRRWRDSRRVTAVSRWPQRGEALLSELRHAPGRLALIVDDRDGSVATAVAQLQGVTVNHAGASLSTDPPRTPAEVMDRLVAAGPVVADLDLLFWKPWLALDPLGVLRVVSRRRPGTLFQWPGAVSGAHATYSSPGRRDWYEATLSDAVVLRPAPALFPDEPPYHIERYP